MTRLGLRLLFAGGRRAVVVFLVTLTAVAVGSTMLLLAFSVQPAMQARADRTAWNSQENETLPPDGDRDQAHTAMWSITEFCPCGPITAVFLTPSGAGAPVFPGLERNPRPGETYVSPAMRSLVWTSPELAERYGRVTGVLGRAALSGPDDLVVVRYLPEERMDRLPAERVTRFATAGSFLGFDPGILQLLVAVGAIALRAPIVLFVAIATRLSAASREGRLAALRLVGATRSQVVWFTGVESLLASIGGVGAGIGLFYAVRPLATFVNENNDRWFVSDLTPGGLAFLVVLVGVPLLASVSAQLTLGRVAMSPLAAARRSDPHRLSLWRLLPVLLLLLAAASLLYSGQAAALGRTKSLMVTFVGLLLALLLVGPWATQALGRLVSASGGASRLLVGRRLVDDPRGAFRAVAGVMLAIFIATIFTATTPAAMASFSPDRSTTLRDGAAGADIDWSTPAEGRTMVRELRSLPGISAADVVYAGTAGNGAEYAAAQVWIGDCGAIAEVVKLSRQTCGGADVLATDDARSLLEAGGTSIRISQLPPAQVQHYDDPSPNPPVTLKVAIPKVTRMAVPPAFDGPAFIISPEAVGAGQLARTRPNRLLIGYESASALERARTIVEKLAPGAQLISASEAIEGNTADARRIRTALLIATFAAFAVAGVSLAISVIIGLFERRRQYALLRATGVPVRVLRRLMFLEAAIPLAAASVLATAFGLVVATGMLRASGAALPLVWALTWPLLAGVALALAMVVCALPAVRRVTDTEEVRFE